MNYEVREKKGANLQLGLTELGEGQFEITIDGAKVRVDAVKSGRTIYSIIEDGRQYEAIVDEKGRHGFDVLVAGRLFHLEAVDERTQLLAASVHHVAAGKQAVAAEMPGKVVRLCVEPGARVSEGQGVVIVEAMKMENEIVAPVAGTVQKVAVAAGARVSEGDLLVEIEPASGEE